MTNTPDSASATPQLPRPRPWERQPGESSRDYLAFSAWLQCPQRHPLREAAAKLGLPSSRLRSFSCRHRWRSRALAYDDHRADAAQEALQRALQQQAGTMQERAERFRQQEWALHEIIMQSAREAMKAFKVSRRRLPGIGDITRLINLASLLGRRACGMAENEPQESPEQQNFRLEVDAALKKIYGPDTQ